MRPVSARTPARSTPRSSWNKGFKEYFAVKATPEPHILKILQEEGCGVDCSSYTELLMGEACGFTGSDIMFSLNETPAQDMQKAYELGAYINLDDLTHVDFLKETAGIPKTVCCRYNPGGVFELGNGIMDNPGDAKYGMSEDQMAEAYTRLMKLGAEEFGIHSFLPATPSPMTIIPSWPASCLNWPSVCTSAPAQKSSLSTCPAAWALPTAPTSAQQRHRRHRRRRAQKSLRRSSCPLGWAM